MHLLTWLNFLKHLALRPCYDVIWDSANGKTQDKSAFQWLLCHMTCNSQLELGETETQRLRNSEAQRCSRLRWFSLSRSGVLKLFLRLQHSSWDIKLLFLLGEGDSIDMIKTDQKCTLMLYMKSYYTSLHYPVHAVQNYLKMARIVNFDPGGSVFLQWLKMGPL